MNKKRKAGEELAVTLRFRRWAKVKTFFGDSVGPVMLVDAGDSVSGTPIYSTVRIRGAWSERVSLYLSNDVTLWQIPVGIVDIIGDDGEPIR